jgi:hypothetical protein
MSVAAINFVFALPIKSSPQKLIMLALANRISDDTGACFPGQALIAQEVTMSERQVREHLAILEREGRIRRYFRHHPNGDRSSDEYEIVGFMEWLKKSTDDAGTPGNPTTGGNPPVAEKRTRKSVRQPAEKRSHNRRVSVVTTGGFP